MRELPAPISVEEALQSIDFDINVEEGTAITVGPFEEQFADIFRLAEVRAFEDLQQLGYIHRELNEEALATALRADDRLFREARRQPSAGQPCDCGDEKSQEMSTISRLQVHDHLIELLQPLFRSDLSPDHPAVLHTYHHTRKWLTRPSMILVGLFAINDINIGDEATLTMTPTVHALYANDISIGQNGWLRFQSGGVHVRCNSLNGPSLPLAAGMSKIDKYVQGLALEAREV
jgi:hypothetical protein